MKTNIFKLGDDLLKTNASEEQVNIFITDLKNRFGHIGGYNIYDLIMILHKCNFTAETVYINTNIKW